MYTKKYFILFILVTYTLYGAEQTKSNQEYIRARKIWKKALTEIYKKLRKKKEKPFQPDQTIVYTRYREDENISISATCTCTTHKPTSKK